MKNFLFFLVIFSFSSNIAADCNRLKSGDNYENLNAILDCIEAIKPKQSLSDTASEFIAGEYIAGDKYRYLLSNNGLVDGNRTVWALKGIRGEYFMAAWITGSAIGHPQIGNLSIASKLPNNFSYGVMTANAGMSSTWQDGGLIAVKQEGDSLTIWSYHKGSTNYIYPTNSFVITRSEVTTK